MACQLSVGLREYRVDNLADELLLCLGQAAELFQLLLQLRRRPALARLGRFANEFFDAGSQRLGQQRQGRDRHASAAGLERGDLLLGHADQFAQLCLGEVLCLAAFGDAGAQQAEKSGLVGSHRYEGQGQNGSGSLPR